MFNMSSPRVDLHSAGCYTDPNYLKHEVKSKTHAIPLDFINAVIIL